jgi:UDPglucose 6-dehydrogenase
VNDLQPERFLNLLDRHGDVAGERAAVLGLAFKPGTDDIQNTRAVPVIEGLIKRDAEIVAHDLVAIPNMRERFPAIEYTDDPAVDLEGATVCLITTGWGVYESLDKEFDAMSTPIVIDGRHCVERREGIIYEGLTW